MPAVRLILNRPEKPGGIEVLVVAYSDDIEEVEYQPQDSYGPYLWELPSDEWLARIEALREWYEQ